MVRKYMKYTQEKIDFVHAMFGNNFPNSIIIRGFKEQFKESINDRQIDYMMKEKTPTSLLVQYERQMEMDLNRAAKAFSFELKEEVVETIVSEVIGETTPEVIEEKEPRFTRTRHKWSDKEELDLLCDFYELSIDEARERFQRPFYAIAKRLEKIVDSTEPKHIDMLMEATKVIKERKRASHKAAKNGFLKRRKVRKQAKKLLKLEKKLSKLRGE